MSSPWRGAALGLFYGLFVVIGSSGLAAAHELQQNNGVSAVLHIAPDDNPVSGQPTALNLDFTSQASGFSVGNCGCTVSTKTTTAQGVVSKVLSNKGSQTLGYAIVTFPQAGVYDVAVKGHAGRSTSQQFQLVYRVRVTAGGGAKASSSMTGAKSMQVIMLSVTGLVVLGVGATEAIRRGGRYAPVK